MAFLQHGVLARILGRLQRKWHNPLLRHARRLSPMPIKLVGRGLAAFASGLAVLTILAWAAGWRAPAAVLMALSLGGVLAPMLLAPVVGAERVARQIRFSRQDPRRLADLDPAEITEGLALVTLWQLRWLIVIALALTPALAIGLLRLGVSGFATWKASAEALGGATPAGHAGTLLPGGHVPYMRLVIAAFSAAVLPWAALPLMASLGVTVALILRDTTLSLLAGLLVGIAVAVTIGLLWNGLAYTSLLAGMREIVRLGLLVGVMIGLVAVAGWLNRWGATLLAQSEEPVV